MPDPDAHDLMPGFRTLGAVSARMHGHARALDAAARLRPLPLGLRDHARRRAATGAAGRTASAWAREELALLGRLDATCARRLEAYGQGPSASASCTPTSGSRTCSSTASTCA